MNLLSFTSKTDNSTTGKPSSVNVAAILKAVRVPWPLIWIAISVLSWLLVADLLVASGTLHRLASLKAPPLRIHSLEQQLFDLDQTDFSSVFVGDRRFIEKAKANLGERLGEQLFLTIPGFHLPDIAILARAIRGRISFKRLILQASPHFWSDLWMRQPALNIDLWLGYGRSRWPDPKRARKVFDTLAERVAAADKSDYGRWVRPETLRGISWVETPRRAQRVMQSLERLTSKGLRSVYWIPDLDELPADISPELLGRFDNRFAEVGFDETFGHVVTDFSELTR
ncbi:MAG: hypothetical protein AAFO01_22825 [Pseudomonadota bacterium]